ncbi:MAG: thioesterase [Melioribacteraceae bacterium]|nr:MAG: thioesterase [Melioribacteraceae bacterium]
MVKHVTEIRVRYADTDKMQFVYNGKYLEYFEVGRTELLRGTGLPYAELEAAGYQLPLIEAKVRYRSPGRYDDLLQIEAVVDTLRSAKVRIDYRVIRKETEEVIATGYTEHMFINSETKRPVKPPQMYVDALAPYFE